MKHRKITEKFLSRLTDWLVIAIVAILQAIWQPIFLLSSAEVIMRILHELFGMGLPTYTWSFMIALFVVLFVRGIVVFWKDEKKFQNKQTKYWAKREAKEFG
jgi:ABC-type transport system involved in cytochrome bd biosynthesis fused ATPase/permease subunit